MKDKKIVPREPTIEMVTATWPLDLRTFSVSNIWRAMYDAAPSTKRQSRKEILEQTAKDYERALKSLATK